MFKWFRSKPQLTLDHKKILAIDLELTGLDAKEDAILSAGTVFILNGRVSLANAEHCLFSPPSMMGSDVTESAHIHMITDHQIKENGKPLSQWLMRLSTDLAADAWLFHYASLDLSFLNIFSERCGCPLPDVEIIDTVQREKKLRANDYLESHAQLSLNACRARYGLPTYRQHHALSDALATAELYLAQQAYSGA